MAPLTVQGGSGRGELSNPPSMAGEGSSKNRLALTILNAGGPGGPPPPRMIVPKNKLLSCNYCYKKLSSSQALGGHQNAHRQEKMLEKQRKAALHNTVPVAYLLFPYPGSTLTGGQRSPLYGSSLGTPSALGVRYGSLVRKPRASYLYPSTLSRHPLGASKNASNTTYVLPPPNNIDKPLVVAPLQAYYNNANPGLALVPSAASNKQKTVAPNKVVDLVPSATSNKQKIVAPNKVVDLVPSAISNKQKTVAPNKVVDLKLIPPYSDVCPETGLDLTLKLQKNHGFV